MKPIEVRHKKSKTSVNIPNNEYKFLYQNFPLPFMNHLTTLQIYLVTPILRLGTAGCSEQTE